MSELRSQIRLAVRRLRRAPVFTTIAVITLAVGIGANAAIFSVVDGVLLRGLPYPNAERLVGVGHLAPNLSSDRLNLSPGDYFTYRAEAHTIQDLGLMEDDEVTITGSGEPERVPAIAVTERTLPLLGAVPLIGRVFGPADDVPGGPLTTVLSYGYWQRRFAGRKDVVGRSLTIDGRAFEVIGVLPESFQILEHRADLYLAAQLDPAHAIMAGFNYPGMARLAPGVTIEQANQELDRILPREVARYPGPVSLDQFHQAGFRSAVRPLKDDVVGDVGPMLWVLLGTVGIVLLLACANVANLFMVQAEGRQREMAVRTALGASRGRIVGGFVTESLVLGLIAGTVGVGLAYGGLRLLLTLGPDLPRLGAIGIDGPVLGFTAAVSLLAGLLFGLMPALRYGRPNLIAGLKEGGRGSSGGRERHRIRNGLVVVQVALALVLLIGSGLMVRSVLALRHVDPGVRRPDEVLTFRVDVPSAEVAQSGDVAELERTLLARLEQIPGVTSAGGSSKLALDGGTGSNSPILVEDQEAAQEKLPPLMRFVFSSPGYLETLGTPLLAGRMLTWDDVSQRAKVVVVSERVARQYWGDPTAAIGRRIRDFIGATPVWYQVVGVVADVRDAGVSQPAPPLIYWPMALAHFWDESLFVPRGFNVVVRASRERVPSLLPEIRSAVWSVNRDLAIARVTTLGALVRHSMARASFAMVMLAIAALVALILGLVGIYGVISYIVAQRTREIGVRIALGARPGEVRGMVVRQAAVVAAIGLAVGLVAAFVLSRLMASLLYGVRPFDPLTYGGVAAIIAGVVLLASYLPARRAAGIDPVTALRAE